jgi:hypothetical protein
VRTALKSASRFRNRTGEATHCRARERERRKARIDDFMVVLVKVQHDL